MKEVCVLYLNVAHTPPKKVSGGWELHRGADEGSGSQVQHVGDE